MKYSSELLVDAPARQVGEVLSDLGTYPHWNELVAEAVPDPTAEDPPAWSTTLRARVGPFARSKQLRFVRALDEFDGDDRQTRFERAELDGRDHAAWVMETSVIAGPSTAVTLTLTYDGGLWVPSLGAILSGAIERSAARLPEYLSATS